MLKTENYSKLLQHDSCLGSMPMSWKLSTLCQKLSHILVKEKFLELLVLCLSSLKTNHKCILHKTPIKNLLLTNYLPDLRDERIFGSKNLKQESLQQQR